ncbi:bactofilin family protein [Pedobacter caeni]|uniref:Protein CcmA, bactofilin family n=1 Tax=Pedobacter caeni TaxID=288992 RepID=A0A1M5B6E4_9SPHI|nr:polymer-forming cytoskeletal protein [Pedobacter caeni]SHF38025.1 hypothetical protein SAMN04488522_1021044 [Pedobacter caeni]
MKTEISIAAFLEALDQLDKTMSESIESACEMLDVASEYDDDPHQVLWYKKPIENYEDILLVEGHKIIILEDDVQAEGDVTIKDYAILIVMGNLQAKNIIVDGHLFVIGNVTCKVLFGASGNDNQTHISGDLECKSVIEDGHYTLIEGEIIADELISNANYIIGKKGLKVKAIVDSAIKDGPHKLHASVLHPDNYFDEEKFLKLLYSGEPYRLID